MHSKKEVHKLHLKNAGMYPPAHRCNIESVCIISIDLLSSWTITHETTLPSKKQKLHKLCMYAVTQVWLNAAQSCNQGMKALNYLQQIIHTGVAAVVMAEGDGGGHRYVKAHLCQRSCYMCLRALSLMAQISDAALGSVPDINCLQILDQWVRTQHCRHHLWLLPY